MTAIAEPVRRLRRRAWSSRSMNSDRFASLVRSSRNTRCSSSRASSRFAVTSRIVTTSPATSLSASMLTMFISKSRTVPSPSMNAPTSSSCVPSGMSNRGVQLAGDAIRLLRSQRFVEPPPDQLVRSRCRESHSRAGSRTRSRPDRSTTKIASFRPWTNAPRRRSPCRIPAARAPAARCHSRRRDEHEHDDRARARNQRRHVAVPGRPRVRERDRRTHRDRGQDAQHPQSVRGIHVDGRARSRRSARARATAHAISTNATERPRAPAVRDP